MPPEKTRIGLHGSGVRAQCLNQVPDCLMTPARRLGGAPPALDCCETAVPIWPIANGLAARRLCSTPCDYYSRCRLRDIPGQRLVEAGGRYRDSQCGRPDAMRLTRRQGTCTGLAPTRDRIAPYEERVRHLPRFKVILAV
jgi:hypothetical protein